MKGESAMTFDELKNKALSLPLAPGVYIMRDVKDTVIYVGKAKLLKNRVSQYFQDTAAHTPKTTLMVCNIDHFDVIVAASEFEALVLECSLIKRHQPKYNILLKDDKGYPYLRLQMKDEYPKLTMVSKCTQDGAQYFGPYGSRGVTQNILKTLCQCLKLPSCNKQFPKDLGKGRVCLHYHMDQCAGWCQEKADQTQYLHAIMQAQHLLEGSYKSVTDEIRSQMVKAADSLNFELAAKLRDQLTNVEALGKKQFVTAGTSMDMDAIGYAQTEAKACFAVLHFSGGALVDKDYEVFPTPDDPAVAVSALIKQYYTAREFAPKRILLPFEVEDLDLIVQLMECNYRSKTSFHVPKRGEKKQLVMLAVKNAAEEAQRVTGLDERSAAVLSLLGKMLSIAPPKRIESFDVSNISGTDIVASMVVFQDGRPRKSEYKRFKIEGICDQNDYASMEQALKRRYRHYLEHTDGFDTLPDLLLIDGGTQHVNVAVKVMNDLGLRLNIFGMVKDDRHRTRSLISSNGEEIAITNQQAVFSIIGTIQEETHRFAIGYHKKLRSRRIRYSELDNIPGIGDKRKQDLLKRYKSLKAIAAAPLADLELILPQDAANAVYQHFHRKGDA